jgi:hypothetical protein
MRLLSALMIFAGLPAFASIENCPKITDDSERLACYDSAMNIADEPSASEEKDLTAWEVTQSTSAMDDSKTVSMVVSSAETLSCG